MSKVVGRIDIDSPRYDQSSFQGRLKYFFCTTNPLNVLVSESELFKAKALVDSYRNGDNVNATEEELWKAKELCDRFAFRFC